MKSLFLRMLILTICPLVSGCASVRKEDTDAWAGQTVSVLDKHPVFLTLRVVRAISEDGTEIRDYVNGKEVVSCSGGGAVFAGAVGMATYNQYMQCSSAVPTCHNIFYIRKGIVERYVPVGTGGARCFTDERARPDFNGSTNF
jgi:hypothetical protein